MTYNKTNSVYSYRELTAADSEPMCLEVTIETQHGTMIVVNAIIVSVSETQIYTMWTVDKMVQGGHVIYPVLLFSPVARKGIETAVQIDYGIDEYITSVVDGNRRKRLWDAKHRKGAAS